MIDIETMDPDALRRYCRDLLSQIDMLKKDECPSCAISKAFHDVAVADRNMMQFRLNEEERVSAMLRARIAVLMSDSNRLTRGER
jgi:hypothetical protein